MTPSRLAAVRVLLALERQQTTLAAEIERTRSMTADERDRALVLELTAGTLRWRNELDAVIAACSRRPIADLAAPVRAVLRLGAYQLRHLDRIPSHAVVHESVEIVKTLQPRAAGFVNAVLRTLTRRGSNIRLPARPDAGGKRDQAIRYLTSTLSHPEWLATRWLDRYGFEAAAAWCEFNNRPAEITVRTLPGADASRTLDELVAAGIEASPAPWVRDAFRLGAGSWSRIPPELRSRLLIQDEASQIVGLTAGARPDERVLDACAAPGGKTIVMAAAMAGRGMLVAADYRPARMRLLASALERSHVETRLAQLDATKLPFGPVFDRVLLDAPCSGLGIVRRDPDIKWTRLAGDQAGYATRQHAMLLSAAEALRPGGTLVYATCSSEPEENEGVVEAFLASRKDMTLVPADPGPAVNRGADLVDDRGMLRTLPFRHGLDAFFCALLVRR